MDLLKKGHKVTIVDDLSKPGSELNQAYVDEVFMKKEPVSKKQLSWFTRLGQVADIIEAGVYDYVFHLAGQTAVTKSYEKPATDFTSNVSMTFLLLSLCRVPERKPHVIFTSSNKVYGDLSECISKSIAEDYPANPKTPYGVSKYCAELYCNEFYRSFQVPITVLRMSCIYGPLQRGSTHQGWVSYMIDRMIRREPITVYGNGLQGRDILYIDDLVRLFGEIMNQPERSIGQTFNIGGGPDNVLTVKELLADYPLVEYDSWRPYDQRHYCSNLVKVNKLLQWSPRIPKHVGLEVILQHLQEVRNVEGLD
jgi:CDP-paratose 2-epimerase